MTYADYLRLDTLLSAQQPLSRPVHHDEMLFIVQHHVSELWMKLVIHELSAAIEGVKRDDLEPVFKVLARVKLIQQQLFSMWGVLETMTPSEYVEFRDVLGRASGFQSIQYRKIEFLLGNKEPAAVEVHRARPEVYDELVRLLRTPSLYDETLRHMARRGLPIPADAVERDWTQPYVSNPGVVTALKHVYEDTERWWDLYELAEKLVDVEEHFQLWRFRHMKTVHRIIGHKVGTGGSSGVSFLRKALDHVFFPELWDVRTEVEKRKPAR
jgi:tryptophan 2,3-dioxygenase